MFTRRIPFTIRFLNKFNSGEPDECWLWLGKPNGEGYGTIREPGRNGKMKQAHRIAFLYHHGRLPDNLDVCHSCDVRLCVNPSHLFLGTHADNNADRDSKGRGNGGGKPGEGCGHAKLTNEKVLAIRRDIRTHREISEAFGVARSTVINIRARRTWKHI